MDSMKRFSSSFKFESKRGVVGNSCTRQPVPNLPLGTSNFQDPPAWPPVPFVMAARSSLNAVFLLHIALEGPVGVQGLLSPTALPFLQLNNTTLVFLKLYSSLVTASCLISLLCFSLPDFLPGKRAVALGFCVYHSIASTILLQTPRFIPYSLGDLAELYKLTPETAWGITHGLLGLGMILWWQATLQITTIARQVAKQ